MQQSETGVEDFAVPTVASVALEAKIEECQQRMFRFNNSRFVNERRREQNIERRKIAVRPFVVAFEDELHRLEGAITNHRRMIEMSVEALLKDADGLFRRKERGRMSDRSLSKELLAMKGLAKDLKTKTLKIIRATNDNQKELNRIALKADSKLRTNCVDDSEREFSKEPWKDNGSAGHIMELLSDIFSLIRQIKEDVKKKDDKWVAPASIERVTKKYWVREDDLPEVLLKSPSKLPILVYGRSGMLTKNPKNLHQGKQELWNTMSSPISSVYFDSEDLDLYKERIQRSEGAHLVRVRWHGRKPQNDDPVFLELKTHHESWIENENESVKEQVVILQKRMNDILDLSGGIWTSDYAKELVREAIGSNSNSADAFATDEQIEASAALLVEIRGLFCKKKMQPCVRKRYTRAAFQNPNNSNLRLAIDQDITVVNDMRAFKDTNNNNNNNNNTPSFWYINDFLFDSIVKVPYDVFEVKVFCRRESGSSGSIEVLGPRVETVR